MLLIRRWPISSGRSGSASGDRAAQVTVGSRSGRGRAIGRNSPARSSYIRSTIVLVSDARPNANRDRVWSTLVRTSQHTGGRRPRRSGAGHTQGLGFAARAARTQADHPHVLSRSDRTEATQPGPTRRAARSRSARHRPGRDARPASRPGERSPGPLPGPHRDPPRPHQGRRLDARRHRRVVGEHVVGETLAAIQRRVPDDRVPNEAVVALRTQKRLELRPGTRGIETPPHHRRETGVPIPLKRVMTRARPRL